MEPSDVEERGRTLTNLISSILFWFWGDRVSLGKRRKDQGTWARFERLAMFYSLCMLAFPALLHLPYFEGAFSPFLLRVDGVREGQGLWEWFICIWFWVACFEQVMNWCFGPGRSEKSLWRPLLIWKEEDGRLWFSSGSKVDHHYRCSREIIFCIWTMASFAWKQCVCGGEKQIVTWLMNYIYF